MNKKAKLRKLCDKLCYEKYLQKTCEICGKKANQLHHFYPKGAFGHLRYTPENLISLCFPCHFILTHQNRRLEDKIREKKGEKWFKNLTKKAYQRPKSSYLTIEYYENILKKLK